MSGVNYGAVWPLWWWGFGPCTRRRCRAVEGEQCISEWNGAILRQPHRGSRLRIRDDEGWVAVAPGVPDWVNDPITPG